MNRHAERKRESALSALINELRAEHSYLLLELARSAERYSMITSYQPGSKRMTLRPASCIRLVVPTDSALGQEIELMRRIGVRAAKRAERNKEARRKRRELKRSTRKERP